jgi:hypothetical protein
MYKYKIFLNLICLLFVSCSGPVLFISQEYKKVTLPTGVMAITMPRDRPEVFIKETLFNDSIFFQQNTTPKQTILKSFYQQVPELLAQKCNISKAGYEDLAACSFWIKRDTLITRTVCEPHPFREGDFHPLEKREKVEIEHPQDSTVFEFPTLFKPDYVLILQKLTIIITGDLGSSSPTFSGNKLVASTLSYPSTRTYCSAYCILWDNIKCKEIANGFVKNTDIEFYYDVGYWRNVLSPVEPINSYKINEAFDDFVEKIVRGTPLYKNPKDTTAKILK